MTERERIEELHQMYLTMRETTPEGKRNGAECKAYHQWYDSAYVYFKSFPHLQSDSDFQIFVKAEKKGNCFVLEHIYDGISPPCRRESRGPVHQRSLYLRPNERDGNTESAPGRKGVLGKSAGKI